MTNDLIRMALVLSGLLAPLAVLAGVTEREAEHLGRDLTPVGAEKAANADGTIPEWNGGITTMPDGWKPGQKRIDPFAADERLYSIDASNVDRYKDKLSEGQIALVKRYAGYRIDVYPTRRSCGYADSFYERTKINAREAKLAANGWELDKAIGAAVIFPIPKNGAEAMWNHKLRYMGEGRLEYYASIFSNKGGNFTPLVQNQWITQPLHFSTNKGIEDAKRVEQNFLNEVVSPAARAGELGLAISYLDGITNVWIYFPGQRRVRRTPALTHDTPIPGYEDLEMADQYSMYYGQMDRYEWKLVGKQELLIPYNSFALIDKSRKYKEIYLADFINPDVMRYELHRVWRVEATLKPGMQHQAPRRVFFLDEDSWAVMVTDLYDKENKLWRVQEASIYPAPEVPACVGAEFISYDLKVGRYLAENATQEQRETDWLAGREGRIPPSKFSPDELRRMGER